MKNLNLVPFELLFFLYYLSSKLRFKRFFENTLLLRYYDALTHSSLDTSKNPNNYAVDIIDNPTTIDFKNKYFLRNSPVLLKNFCKNWPATKKWSFAHFENNYGELRFQARMNNNEDEKELPFKIILKNIREKEAAPSVDFRTLFDKAPQLLDDFKLTELRKLHTDNLNHTYWQKVYIGSRGYLSYFHMDIGPNFLLNIVGEKEFLLCPFESTKFLYPIPSLVEAGYTFGSFAPARKIFSSTHSTAFPLLKYAKKRRVILSPGDALYIPPLTWHAANYLSANIGCATWWKEPKLLSKQSVLFLILCFGKILTSSFNKPSL